MACGFSIKEEEKLKQFRKKISGLAAKALDSSALIPKLKIEMELSFSLINLDLAQKINSLAPYGQNNPQPRFVSYNLRLDDIVIMGLDSQHIKLRLSAVDPETQATQSFWAIAFGAAQNYKYFKTGDMVDLVYYLEINEFNGRREPQLKIVDIRMSEGSVV